MTEKVCAYPGRDETLVAYVYDDITPAERGAFNAHLALCAVCRDELAGLTTVRGRLATWMPPEPVRPFTQPEVVRPARSTRFWTVVQEAPAWAQLAAAVLVLGVSAGAANLHIKYGGEGLSVRTGWSASADQTVQPASVTASVAVAQAEPSVSREDLAALEQRLKAEIDAASADRLTVERARALIAESEGRQQKELVLRVAGVAQDSRAQRERELMRLSSIVTAFQNSTRDELAVTRTATRSNAQMLAKLVGQ